MISQRTRQVSLATPSTLHHVPNRGNDRLHFRTCGELCGSLLTSIRVFQHHVKQFWEYSEVQDKSDHQSLPIYSQK